MPTKEEKAVLAQFRRQGECELCEIYARLQPHHVRAKGRGAGFDLNDRLNLLGLCSRCHQILHDMGLYGVLMILVAKREGRDFNECLVHVREALLRQRDE
jgi:hypothetical protein